MTASQRHARHSSRFGEVVSGVTDWDAQSPVPQWQARDVLAHLIDWSVEFFAAGGLELSQVADRWADPGAAWNHHAAQIQELLDGGAAPTDFTHPRLGTQPLDESIDRFYTTDVFLHTWDLARASGQDARLDPSECAELLAGMEPIEEMLRASGQFGAERVEVPEDASVQDRLIGFIGRDPQWASEA